MGRIVFVLCRIALVSLRLILRIKGYVSVAWGLFCAVFVVVVVGCWLEIGVRVVGVRMGVLRFITFVTDFLIPLCP